MIVTRIEKVKKSEIKVYLNEQYPFFMNTKEAEQYGIKEDSELSNDKYNEILEQVVLRRAKEKAINILKFMDRTEEELRRKLSDAYYQNEIIDLTIKYLKEYGYINDERYASSYISSRINGKSRRMLRNELAKKGIAGDVLEHVLAAEYEKYGDGSDPEEAAIQREIARKIRKPGDLTKEAQNKLIASLYRKGYGIHKIRRCLEENYSMNVDIGE